MLPPLRDYQVQILFVHDHMCGEEWYAISADHAQAAQFNIAMAFGMDILLACMRTGLETKPHEFHVRRVVVHELTEEVG